MRRLTSLEQSLYIVKPEFRHTIVIGLIPVLGDGQAVTLHQSADAGNLRADGTVDILLVAEEFLIGQVPLLRDAVHQFDHVF